MFLVAVACGWFYLLISAGAIPRSETGEVLPTWKHTVVGWSAILFPLEVAVYLAGKMLVKDFVVDPYRRRRARESDGAPQ